MMILIMMNSLIMTQDDENIESQEIDENVKIVEMPDTEIYRYGDSPSIEMDDEHIDQQVFLPHNDQMVLLKIIKRNKLLIDL